MFLLYYLNIFDLGLLCIAHDSMKYLLKKRFKYSKESKKLCINKFPLQNNYLK